MNDLELNEKVSFLSQVSFFSEVSTEALTHLCTHVIVESYHKQQVVFNKNDEGDAMYVIYDGQVNIHEGKHSYGLLSVGDCFGEYALIDNQSRSASVTAIQATKVLKIERDYFLDLMTHDAGFAKGVLAVMIKRHRELDTIQERLASSKHELELANSKMKGLIDGAMDAIIMFDQNFKIVLTNPSANELLENNDVIQRNILFFFDDESANLIESIVKQHQSNNALNQYIPNIVKVIGSNEKETLNEGTINTYGDSNNTFYTLILRNIEERIAAEDTISLLTHKATYLEQELKSLTHDYGIIANDDSMRNVLKLIHQVAQTTATVLIHGETGTGKELVARAIHNASDRKDQPLIRINCGAIPINLIESELFGHKKGAFTGAITDRQGRFQLADKGTIFLDEIGELPLELQPKLLRVIQEGEFDPVGSSETIKVDVRIIAATHRDLLNLVKEGTFREDLFYRLNVFPVQVPALRERGNDINLIAQEMLTQSAKKLNRKPIQLSEDDKNILLNYDWPGNVRELQNLIERAIIISQSHIDWRTIIPRQSSVAIESSQEIPSILTSKELIALEKENILRALRQTKWKISGVNGAAAILQLPPTTLASKIKALGIERPI